MIGFFLLIWFHLLTTRIPVPLARAGCVRLELLIYFIFLYNHLTRQKY